ncbi:glycosyltransferase [Flavobacterium sp. UMI-01]|uniref:glycosyltransferase n=1 Tax=Flavobacterium sp. UMI-01 TaxID=1441053 RepID=UPI001C7CC2BC|nr:glycosyltransferase [Flavobacterium sp. UMI-01]GIZ08723.1 hypothetical protein FUMI01_14500 [Flavobacterium sp. UMI-01]
MYDGVKIYFKNLILKSKLKKEKNVIDYYSLVISNFSNKKVLIIDDKLPEYDKDSGSRRLNLIIKLLLKNNVGVFLLADFKEYKFKKDYLSYYKDMGVIVYEPSLNNSNDLITKREFIIQIINQMDLVWLHRPNIFYKYHSFIRKMSSTVSVVYDMVDFHYLRMMREANLKKDKKLECKAAAFLEIEVENCTKANKIIVISENDKKSLLEYYQDQSKMIVIGNIHDSIKLEKSFLPFEQRNNLLFVGGFDHLPNIDAVKYLKYKVMPLIWAKHPNIKVQIIGSNPTAEILNLEDYNFEILGYVPDLAIYFNSSKLFVAPLQFGAGIKGKIGQSLEFGLPLITTDIGAEGFDFGDFKTQMIADSPEDFSNKIISLYNDNDLWFKISEYSSNILKPFSSKIVLENCMNLFEKN